MRKMMNRLKSRLADTMGSPHEVELDYNYEVSSSDTVADARLLGKALQHPTNAIGTLAFYINLGSKALGVLGEGLSHANCKTTGLWFLGVELSDDEADMLHKILIHPTCKVTGLGFCSNAKMNLSKLKEILTDTRCKIRELMFGEFHATFEIMDFVGDVLKHPLNKLQDLNIHTSQMDAELFRPVFEGLTHPNNKVRLLEVDKNRLGNEGSDMLAQLLRSPHCRITNINFQDNQVHQMQLRQLVCAAKQSHLLSFQANQPSLNDAAMKRQLETFGLVLGSKWMKIVLTLLSVRHVPRVGARSGLYLLSCDLIRLMAHTLPFEK